MDQKPGKTQSLEEASPAAATARHKIVTAWTLSQENFCLTPSRLARLPFSVRSISTATQYVTLDNKIKYLSLAVFFGNLNNKIITGTAYTWELLIENHLDQSLWSTNQKYWAAIRSNLLHSFLEAHNCIVPFTSHGKLHEFVAE
jgi:hypothetical protein